MIYKSLLHLLRKDITSCDVNYVMLILDYWISIKKYLMMIAILRYRMAYLIIAKLKCNR